MCLLENELESQLGEFHIRMKGTVSCSIPALLPACLLPADAPLPSLAGLAGFARLCAGDQYEVGGTVWVGFCSSSVLLSLGCLRGVGGCWRGGHLAGWWRVARVHGHAWGHTESTQNPGVSPIPKLLHPQIFMKYGRQRWKLRGRIEVNSKQVWDSEEMVFLPLVTEFLSIKVQCIKGQGWAGPAVPLHHLGRKRPL